MILFNADQVDKSLQYPVLIEKLRQGFKKELGVPKRHHHNYPNPPGSEPSTLLLMPAWEAGKNLGVKIVNVSPENGKYDLPSIHGIYLFFDARTGQPLASMDSNTITKKRTAATSALASSFLSRKNTQSMLMVGTGTLAPELIQAHCSVRNITQVTVWGRNFEKAKKLSEKIKLDSVEIRPIQDLELGVKNADLISVATLSKDPLISGSWLKPGQYLDLVGSYRPDMREADDEVIRRSEIYIDSYKGAPTESGDLAIPLENGILKFDEIQADLFELCREQADGRISEESIICFKSVGHALEDLVAAQLVYEQAGIKNER